MTDREMLEWAARAAGIIGKWVEGYGSGDYYYQGNQDGIYFEHPDGGFSVWNPLDDDGDVARLETACVMNIFIDRDGVSSKRAGITYCYESYASHGGDRNKARRRASTRAAAEIGRQMGEG